MGQPGECRANGAEMKILVAEDNADDVVLLQHAFERAAVKSQLNSVSDGVEALDYLKGEGSFTDRQLHPFPDLLLLDLNMPRKNGFEVLEWVRRSERYAQLIVHVLTASSLDADVERAYALHANSYTVKPSRFDELVSFVTALHQWHKFVSLPFIGEQKKSVASKRV